MRKLSCPQTLLLAVALAAGLPGWANAQSNPSTDQIINSLKPTGNMGGLTRGLRPSGAPAPSSSIPTAPAVVGSSASHAAAAPSPRPQAVATARPMPAQQSTPSVNLTIEFASGSADLTPQAMHTLDSLGRALSSNDLAAFRFRIEGHTDTVGSRESNQALSERRAQAVVDYVVNHFKVDRARLEPVGMGEDGLLVPTPAQTPELRNRRVLVVNVSA